MSKELFVTLEITRVPDRSAVWCALWRGLLAAIEAESATGGGAAFDAERPCTQNAEKQA